MTTEVELCSQASVLCGGQPFLSFDDETAEAIIAKALYEDQRDWLLGMHRWRFASNMVVMNRLVDAPDARFTAAYAIPADTLAITTVLIGDYMLTFDRFADSILCDADPADVVILDRIVRVPIAAWPVYFTNALRALLASVFAVPIAEDVAKADFYDKRFRLLLAQGKTTDSQGRTAKAMPMGGFTAFAIRRGRIG